MMEYLEKYNSLPLELRQNLAGAGIISAIQNLESKYNVSLALVVIKAAIGEFNPANLKIGLMADLKVVELSAEKLASDLIGSVFFVLPSFKVSSEVRNIASTVPVVTKAVVKELSPIDLQVIEVIKKAKIDLASQALMDRLKQVMRTYILGVRDNIAVRDALTKPFETGGLAFSKGVCDELIKIADGKETSPTQVIQNTRPSLPVNLGSTRNVDYDLLGALKAKGEANLKVDPMANQSRLAQQIVDKGEPVKKTTIPNNLPWQGGVVEEKNIVTSKTQPIVSNVIPSIEVPKPSSTETTSVAKAILPKSSPIVKLTTKEELDTNNKNQVVVDKPATQSANRPVIYNGVAAVDKSNIPKPTTNNQLSNSTPTIPASSAGKQPSSHPTIKAISKATKNEPSSLNSLSVHEPITIEPPAIVNQPIEKYSTTDYGEIKMNDIEYTPRVFTPIDELKYMSLKNFRNLSPEPSSATQIIKHKIETLGKDDYSWKLEGIMAWKQSPINKMYVDIYQTAMNEGKQINQIIETKKKAGADALTSVEFEAIFSFNQEISVYK